MFIAKKIAVRFVISLTAGIATTVGVRLTNAILDKTTCDKTCVKTKKSVTA